MSVNVTRVRVRPEGKGHKHHANEAAPGDWPRPEWVVIYATPVVPNALTLCDTEWLWRVPDEEVLRLSGEPPLGPAYVCEHQVEID